MRPAHLLARLLCVVAPMACTAREEKESEPYTIEPAPPPGSLPPARNTLPEPVPASSVPEFVPLKKEEPPAGPYRRCDATDRAKLVREKASFTRAMACYPYTVGACLGLLAPTLPEKLQTQVSCIDGGPLLQKDPGTGVRSCCYATVQATSGRPLTIASVPRLSPVHLTSAWS